MMALVNKMIKSWKKYMALCYKLWNLPYGYGRREREYLVMDPSLHAVGLNGRQGAIATEGNMNVREIKSSGDRSGGRR